MIKGDGCSFERNNVGSTVLGAGVIVRGTKEGVVPLSVLVVRAVALDDVGEVGLGLEDDKDVGLGLDDAVGVGLGLDDVGEVGLGLDDVG